jgi:hypothetical protein
MRRGMTDSTAHGSNERPRRDHVLWISNLAVIVFTLAFLWAAFAYYRSRMTAVSVSPPSILTTEWRLLRELKSQTDQELFQKDREIADLYGRYIELIRTNAPSSELQRVSEQLSQAKEERSAILSRAAVPTAGTDSARNESLGLRLSSSNDLALTGLLQKQIAGLQAELDRSRAIIDALDRQRTSLLSTQQQAVQQYDDAASENRDQIRELSAALSKKDGEIRAALAALKQLAREAAPAAPPGMEDLRTQALVRALVGSPQIRATYPDLVKSLDHFLDVYGQQQRREGQQDAYASAESILEPVAGQAGAP